MAKPSNDEIQKAHDILFALCRDPEAPEMPECLMKSADAALQTLCWILDHPNGRLFPVNLSKIKRAFKNAGFELVER